ncbi:aminodeoxychorismate/anthranilate synthase component II [Candidatus Gracilibacteria bacterium]|nr:aminodeoxychorismate/anthranilate synthase component II [Candidatus Gracilibacteria bacterium]
MILLIDNYDSFTYNLFQQIESLGAKVIVKKHDEDISKLKPSKIVISPGPGRPEDAGNSMKVIKKFYKSIPILGVCLGHQCIGEIFGSKIIQAQNILHGKTSEIFHTEDKLFHGLTNPVTVARYHSLVIDKTPKDFSLTAWDENDEIMAIHHNKYPLFGIQFHPESFLTTEGNKLMQNFLNV